jgi:predicted N-acyltransferase
MEVKLGIHQHEHSTFLESPITHGDFYTSLEQSKTLDEKSGWIPFTFQDCNNTCYGFEKHHSYGEFIFDWGWAEAYQRYQVPYYPKLLHSTPYTPVNAPKILGDQNKIESFCSELKEYYVEQNHLSGHHYLFTTEEENKALEKLGYSIRSSLQYHLPWPFKSFDEFLDSLKSRKRKNIKKERSQVQDSGLRIEKKLLKDCTQGEVLRLFDLYLQTILKKYSQAYLNFETFSLWQKTLGDKMTLVSAYLPDDEKALANSIFFHSDKTLYGRYWGIDLERERDFPFLHFELCYYQGMDLCCEKGLSLFEAGAQGEQKLLRGFKPVRITSAHHLRQPQLFDAVKDFIIREGQSVRKQIDELSNYLPYK